MNSRRAPLYWLMIAALISPAVASAGELPNELLLRCEIEQSLSSSVAGSPKPIYSFNKVTLDYRLKNGVFSWSGNPVPIAVNCSLRDGDVICSWSGVVPFEDSRPFGSLSQKRQSSVRLTRATGQIGVVLKTWDYADADAKGQIKVTGTVLQNGICHSIGSPVF
jgi:hypothetical protein